MVVVTPVRPSWAPGQGGGQWLVRSHWSGFLPIPPRCPLLILILIRLLILILQRCTLSAPPSGALVLCCTQPMSFLVRVGTWWYILVAVGTIWFFGTLGTFGSFWYFLVLFGRQIQKLNFNQSIRNCSRGEYGNLTHEGSPQEETLKNVDSNNDVLLTVVNRS